jgi:hypothetical protein
MSFSHRVQMLHDALDQRLVIHPSEPRLDKEGRRCYTILETLAPEVYKGHGSARYCPKYLMPTWMASVTKYLDTWFSGVAWTVMVREYAALVSCFHYLSDADWFDLECAVRKMVIRHAEPHVGDLAEQKAYPIIDEWLRGADPHPRQWNPTLMLCRNIAERRKIHPRYGPHQPRYLAHLVISCVIDGKSAAGISWSICHLADMYGWIAFNEGRDYEEKKQKAGWALADELFKMLREQIKMRELPGDAAPLFDLEQETQVIP